MKVMCIQERQGGIPDETKVGEIYYVDRDSIYLDSDGDAYGEVFADKERHILLGNKRLNRFQTMV